MPMHGAAGSATRRSANADVQAGQVAVTQHRGRGRVLQERELAVGEPPSRPGTLPPTGAPGRHIGAPGWRPGTGLRNTTPVRAGEARSSVGGVAAARPDGVSSSPTATLRGRLPAAVVALEQVAGRTAGDVLSSTRPPGGRPPPAGRDDAGRSCSYSRPRAGRCDGAEEPATPLRLSALPHHSVSPPVAAHLI